MAKKRMTMKQAEELNEAKQYGFTSSLGLLKWLFEGRVVRRVNGKPPDKNGNVVVEGTGPGGSGITGDYVQSVNGQTGAVSVTPSNIGAVPAARTVNGQALRKNIVLSASDILMSSSGTLTVYNAIYGQIADNYELVVVPAFQSIYGETLSDDASLGVYKHEISSSKPWALIDPATGKPRSLTVSAYANTSMELSLTANGWGMEVVWWNSGDYRSLHDFDAPLYFLVRFTRDEESTGAEILMARAFLNTNGPKGSPWDNGIDITGDKTPFVEVWSNESPDSAFPAQTITCELWQYSFAAIEYRQWTDGSANDANQLVVGMIGTDVNMPIVSGFASSNSGRRIATLNPDGVTFGYVGYDGKTGNNSTRNRYCIPLRIYGVKSTKGDKGDKGETGEPGEAGAKGETGEKGDKGDPFTYEDFTQEQLDGLTEGIAGAVEAESAKKLSTARQIELTGEARGQALFDGSEDVEIYTHVESITNTELEEILQ